MPAGIAPKMRWSPANPRPLLPPPPRLTSPRLPPPEPDLSACIARFSSGVEIELHRESGTRWLMWEVRFGRRSRRKDFASPSMEHAKLTAQSWYGQLVDGWRELKPRKLEPSP